MEDKDAKIVMIMDDGTEAEFTVLEATTLGGYSYILVTDAPDDEDGECYVLRDISDPDDEEAEYESVNDDALYDALISIFRTLLEGEIDIEK